MDRFPKKLLDKLKLRTEENALRELPVRTNLVDFSSNDYLGIAENEAVFNKATSILIESGLRLNGATGSRLLSGNHGLYDKLEKMLVEFHKTEAALVFNSGYDANIGLFSSVPQRGDFVFFDEFIHASIRDGINLGNAKSYKFKHNDLLDLKTVIERSVRVQLRTDDTNVYIVTESVFSMDGDSPDLNGLAQFCKQNKYHLIVDEAHAVGVFGTNGEGIVQKLEIQDDVFARIITFGKAMGCHGAAVLGSNNLKRYLVNYARSFIYTTGLSPHAIAAILASYNYLDSSEGNKARKKLKENIALFDQELENLDLKSKFIPNNSAIRCCKIVGNEKVKNAANQLQEQGFGVKPIMSPTVNEGEERLRFCLHSLNTENQIKKVLNLLKSVTL